MEDLRFRFRAVFKDYFNPSGAVTESLTWREIQEKKKHTLSQESVVLDNSLQFLCLVRSANCMSILCGENRV